MRAFTSTFTALKTSVTMFLLSITAVAGIGMPAEKKLSRAHYTVDYGTVHPITHRIKTGFLMQTDYSRKTPGAQVTFSKIRGPATIEFQWEISRDANESDSAYILIRAENSEEPLESKLIHSVNSKHRSGSFFKRLAGNETFVIQIGVESAEAGDENYSLSIYDLRQIHTPILDRYLIYDDQFLSEYIFHERLFDGTGDALTYIPKSPVPTLRPTPGNIPYIPSPNRNSVPTPLTAFNTLSDTGDALTQTTPENSSHNVPDSSSAIIEMLALLSLVGGAIFVIRAHRFRSWPRNCSN